MCGFLHGALVKSTTPSLRLSRLSALTQNIIKRMYNNTMDTTNDVATILSSLQKKNTRQFEQRKKIDWVESKETLHFKLIIWQLDYVQCKKIRK